MRLFCLYLDKYELLQHYKLVKQITLIEVRRYIETY